MPKLLIVDDEPSVALTLKMVFERRGHQVDVAGSCAESLQRFADGQRYDGVITDLCMERADIGLEVARAAQLLTPRPVVVICTGFATLDNSQKALELKVDYLALKPVDLEEFIRVIDRLLARRAKVREMSA